MEFKETEFEGLIEIQPRVFHDERGFFLESFREDLFQNVGIVTDFVQDNTSYSSAGVLRGLHLQKDPFAQAKLVRAPMGELIDICVDLRPDSGTFRKVYSTILTAEKGNMLFIPEGFAHGFAALTDCVIHYKANNYYNKEAESGILWDDPDLKIDWMVKDPIISEKDLQLPTLEQFTSQFL